LLHLNKPVSQSVSAVTVKIIVRLRLHRHTKVVVLTVLYLPVLTDLLIT